MVVKLETEVQVPRLRTVVAFAGGVVVALVMGLVPSELVGSLREWAGRAGPDPDDDPDSKPIGRRSRARQKVRPSQGR